MAKRRSSPALFELLSEEKVAGGSPPPASPTQTESEERPKQMPPVDRSEPVEPAVLGPAEVAAPAGLSKGPPPPIEAKERKAAGAEVPEAKPSATVPSDVVEKTPAIAPAASPGPEQDEGNARPRLIPLTSMTIAYAATSLLAFGVVGYILGYAARQAESDAALLEETVVPPDPDLDIPYDPVLVDPLTSPEPDVPRRSLAVETQAGDEDGRREPVIPVDTERRQAGLNYLALGVIDDLGEAERLVRFLEANDMPAQVNRVRTRTGQRWQIQTLHGITGREYARNLAERRDHEARVAQLGRVWLDQAEGTLDFTTPDRRQWTKYDP